MVHNSGTPKVKFIMAYISSLRMLPFVILSNNETIQMKAKARKSTHSTRHRHFSDEKTG